MSSTQLSKLVMFILNLGWFKGDGSTLFQYIDEVLVSWNPSCFPQSSPDFEKSGRLLEEKLQIDLSRYVSTSLCIVVEVLTRLDDDHRLKSLLTVHCFTQTYLLS